MAYKVKFPDGHQLVINSLSEKIEYLCHKDYYEPILIKGKVSDNIEAWNVSIYKENNYIKIDLPLKPESLTVKVNFVDDKGNPLSGLGKNAKVTPSGKEKIVGETLFATFTGEAIKLIDQTKVMLNDDTYDVSSVKYVLDRKELLVTVKKIVLGCIRIVAPNSQYDGAELDIDLHPIKSNQQSIIEKIKIPYQINKLKVGSYILAIKSNHYKAFTTTIDIKSEKIIDVPVNLLPTLKNRIGKSFKDNRKSVCSVLCMVIVMVSLLLLQDRINSEETSSLVYNYTDKISQIENEKSTLLDSVLLLKAVIEVNSGTAIGKHIQQIKSKIDYSVNRIIKSRYTCEDIREIERYKKWPILFVDTRIMNNISLTLQSSEQDASDAPNRASTYRKIQEEVEHLIENAKEKLSDEYEKNTSSKYKRGCDDDFYSRKREKDNMERKSRLRHFSVPSHSAH